jgi:hypothetical protein
MTPAVKGCDSWQSMIRQGIEIEKTALANARTLDWGYLGPDPFHSRLRRNRHVRPGDGHGNGRFGNYSNGDAHGYKFSQPIIEDPCCCQG